MITIYMYIHYITKPVNPQNATRKVWLVIPHWQDLPAENDLFVLSAISFGGHRMTCVFFALDEIVTFLTYLGNNHWLYIVPVVIADD